MDQILYLILGVITVALVSYDLIFTTFAPRGSGFITDTVTTSVWKLFSLFCKVTGSRVLLNGAGIIIVCTMLILWVLLLWTGNILIFMSDKNAIVNSTTNIPADLNERIYYTGYILSTMGNGDFKAGTDGWRIFSALISFSGLILITIAISYMVPVLSAITGRRALSIRIAAIGDSPQQMLLNNWDGKSFERLNDQLSGMAQSIAEQGQLHLAYPVLHYFHQTEKRVALLPNLAALDEAITLLLLYIPEDCHPKQQQIIPLRKAISTFLESLTSIFLKPDNTDVPAIDISEIRRKGIPLKQPTIKELEQLDLRRKTLKAMVDNDGWSWNEVDKPSFNKEMDLSSIL
ncbi:ion channel [Pontibacter sp. MBLB2868]|uniref:ion channel n=1 Tax=Pontibacter sp. MBLB2868 TaxID=3451555 RepID=UPI003F74B165